MDKYKNSYRNNRRFIQDNPQDSEFGEMVYVEPNTNQVSSPMMDSQENYEQNEQQIDNQQKDNAYHQTFGKNMKKIFNRPKPEQQIPSRYDEEIYSELCKLKRKNSYRGYLTVILIDTKKSKILKEELVSSFDIDDTENKLAII